MSRLPQIARLAPVTLLFVAAYAVFAVLCLAMFGVGSDLDLFERVCAVVLVLFYPQFLRDCHRLVAVRTGLDLCFGDGAFGS